MKDDYLLKRIKEDQEKEMERKMEKERFNVCKNLIFIMKGLSKGYKEDLK